MWQQPDACYALTRGIDLQGITWVGPLVDSFSGALDGRGHTLNNLYIQGTEELGLFGQLHGSVENLDIEQALIWGLGGDYIGTICGIDRGYITQCNADTIVIGYDYVGGVSGKNMRVGCGQSNVRDSHTSGSVIGHDYVGGIIGYGGAENCTSDCSVVGHDYVGQLFGDD